MHLLQQFKTFISEKRLFQNTDRLLLAVSGGIDSAVLCELCYQSGFDFIIAHVNFQLRGEESERDEAFVRSLAKKYNKEILVKKIDTKKYAEENKVSVQAAARELRYTWFHETIRQYSTTDAPVRYIVTAHHLDDNIETVLMHFFRGTGIAGLRGIQPGQGNIVRPLLFAKKGTLKSFAIDHQLKWVEDSSNESDKYARNYLRNQLLPSIRHIFPDVENNLADNINRFIDIEQLYQQSIDQHKKKLLLHKENEIHIPALKLKKSQPLHTICYEIIKDFGFTPAQVPEVIDLMDSETGRYMLSSTHRILKNRNWLIISPKQSQSAQIVLIEKEEKKIFYADRMLLLENCSSSANGHISTAPLTATLDADAIRFPLILRKWKKGDYFYPLGMAKKKKLARFFIDNKLSQVDKEKIWVLEMNKKIIWVIGMRIDERFKITPKTKNILKVTASSL